MSIINFINKGVTEIDFHIDCVVNSTNSMLVKTGAVCEAIFNAAGAAELTKECKSIGYCDVGNAVITKGYNLSNYIIHTVGPKFTDNGSETQMNQLSECYKNSLLLAKKHNIDSIVFPLISSGALGCSKEKAWEIALSTCLNFIFDNNEYDIKIYFAATNYESFKFGKSYFPEILKKFEPRVLREINRDALKENIDYFCKYTGIEKIDGGNLKNGVIVMPHAKYPDGLKLFEILNTLGGTDWNYQENIKEFRDKIPPTELNVFQIRTYLTFIYRGERLCDGYIARYMKDRTLLKLFLRLDDLVKLQEKKDKLKK